MIDIARKANELFGLRISKHQAASLERYQEALMEWNARYNLTAIREEEQIRAKHFLDSLSCVLAMRDTRCRRVIDIGTGAGFPGLPLKIIKPELQVTLVDSVEKKVSFCRHVVDLLGLEGVTVVKARAEDAGRDPAHREQYDWAVGRAVAVLPVLAEYLLPLVSVGGRALAMKGESAAAEAQSAEHAIRMLGGHLRQLVPVVLPGVVEQRFLVVMDKTAATSAHYPRRPGIPAKKPLSGHAHA